MELVNKNNPDHVVGSVSPSIKSRLIDGHDDSQIQSYLEKIYKAENWIVCDCRSDYQFIEMPALSVVLRGGKYHLRNLYTRKDHNPHCPFMYLKGAPWFGGAKMFEKNTRKFPSVENTNLSRVFTTLLFESECIGFDPNYSFVSALERMDVVSKRIECGDFVVGSFFHQSHKFTPKNSATGWDVSVFIAHNFDFESSTISRDNEEYSESFPSGVHLPYNCLTKNGPWLAMCFYHQGKPFGASLMPISSRRHLVPVRNESERIVSNQVIGYIEWMKAKNNIEMSFSKIINTEKGYLKNGFNLSSESASTKIVISEDKDSVLFEDGVITVGMKGHDVDPKGWATSLKYSIRKALKLNR